MGRRLNLLRNTRGLFTPCFVLLLWTGALAHAQEPASAAALAKTHLIMIKDYRFQPATLTITVGDTVRWQNEEKRTSHSVLFLAREIPESERIFPDEHWQMTFTEAGVFSYRCGPHPEMRGLIEVIGAQTSSDRPLLIVYSSPPDQK